MHCNHLPSPSLGKVFEPGIDRANEVELGAGSVVEKPPNGMGKISTPGVLRLRATKRCVTRSICQALRFRGCDFIDFWRFFDPPKLFVFSFDFFVKPIKLQPLRMTILLEN